MQTSIFQATTLGLLGGLHFQLGHFLSAILAGEFITHAGFKAAWWIYATFILGIGALYVTADTLLPKIGRSWSLNKMYYNNSYIYHCNENFVTIASELWFAAISPKSSNRLKLPANRPKVCSRIVRANPSRIH